MTNQQRLSGVFAPIVTPFKNDEILYDGLKENIKKLNETKLSGYFVLGTNGEFKSLSVEERFTVLKTIVEYAADDKIVMAGTSAESTKETIDLTLEAAKIGVAQVSLLMPSFFQKHIDDDVLTTYIIEVADRSPVPVVLYNNPSVAADVLISPEVIRRVSNHPNVIGIKDSSRGHYQEYINAAADDFYLVAGSASFFYEALREGAVGGVLSLANVYPKICVELFDLFLAGRLEEAKTLNKKIVELNKKVSGFGGVAAVKAAMDILGYSGGELRRPLKNLTKEEKRILEKELRAADFN